MSEYNTLKTAHYANEIWDWINNDSGDNGCSISELDLIRWSINFPSFCDGDSFEYRMKAVEDLVYFGKLREITSATSINGLTIRRWEVSR